MRFGLLQDPLFQKHRAASHVERPERLAAIDAALTKAEFACDLLPVSARLATDEELSLCHRPSVIQTVAELTAAGGGNIDPDTYLNVSSDQAARSAVGGGIDLCQNVLKGELDRGFVLARPPGHHATPERSMGFCLYSTVAIVAKACRALADRILIFDWDVHHGNGTQDCLYDHDGTCFVSMHQTRIFPGSGYSDERGFGAGLGSIYNIPLPAGCGDEEYHKAYLQIVRPIIQQYDPQLIIVSAGFDAHKDDLLGGMKVTSAGFRQMARWLADDCENSAAKGRLVGFLEGGYHLKGLADSLVETLQAWTESDSSSPCSQKSFEPEVGRCSDEVIRLLAQLHTKFGLS